MDQTGIEESTRINGRERIWGELKKTVKAYLEPVIAQRKSDPLKIVSVGCGFGYEVEPLLDVFPNSTYKGIDINPSFKKGAANMNSDIDQDRVQFEVGDEREPGTLGEKRWDIVFVKNPQVRGSNFPKEYGSVADRQRIIRSSMNAVSQNGILFITAQTKEEKDILKTYFAYPKYKIVIDTKNRVTQSTDTNIDEHILVVKRI